MVSMSRMPPKYSCTICGKMFRRKKQHFNHVMKAHKNGKQATNKVIIPQIDQELVSLKDPIVHYDPVEYQWYGAPYDYHYPGLATGNRHLRAGVPFKNDPLRRTIQPRTLPKAMVSLGTTLPRISQYRKQAI